MSCFILSHLKSASFWHWVISKTEFHKRTKWKFSWRRVLTWGQKCDRLTFLIFLILFQLQRGLLLWNLSRGRGVVTYGLPVLSLSNVCPVSLYRSMRILTAVREGSCNVCICAIPMARIPSIFAFLWFFVHLMEGLREWPFLWRHYSSNFCWT